MFINKITSASPVNGQPATLVDPPVAPYENWVSYYGGSDFNGIAARYFARVNSRGEAVLEAISNQGSVLFTERRITTVPMIVNVPPSDIPAGVDNPATSADLSPFIAAVFGDQATLEQLKRLYNSPQAPRTFGGQTLQEPYFESANQGRFINAGSFDKPRSGRSAGQLPPEPGSLMLLDVPRIPLPPKWLVAASWGGQSLETDMNRKKSYVVFLSCLR